ncbi:MAG TPA: amidohydrolase, partial [Gemmatimonas sp.]|nr:amidohydrolase [Gemmatimonas sp.]
MPTIRRALFVVAATLTALLSVAPEIVAQTVAPNHGVRPRRLVIRNAMVIEGNGTPAEGPKDIVVEGNTITSITALDPVAVSNGTARRPAAGDAEIDATGKYVMPGLINLHGHVQDERGGVPQPLDYQLKLWLGMGITTVRDVSSETARTLQLRARSLAGTIAAPRLYVYARYAYMPVPRNEAEARQRVRDLKAQGVDGLKLFGMDKDVYGPVLDEAKRTGLRTAHHMAVDETNAWDAAAGGLTSIEHWYGVPDAAILSGA